MKIEKFTIKDLAVLLLWLFVSTYINNYFFFKHASRDVDRDIIHLAKNIKAFTSYCMQAKDTNELECISDLKTFIEKTPVYYKTTYSIIDHNGKEIFHVGKLYDQDNVYGLSFIQANQQRHRFKKLFSKKKFNLSEVEINELSHLPEINATFNIEKDAPPSTMGTVYNSLTFSVTRWLPKVYNEQYSEAFEDIVNIALPRSWTTIFLSIFAYFIYRYIQYRKMLYLASLKRDDKDNIVTIRDTLYKDVLKEEFSPYQTTIEKVISLNTLFDLLHTYPSAVVSECRKIGESIVDAIQYFDPYEYDQNKKINTLFRQNNIDKKVKLNLHNIRILGNIAAHDKSIKMDKNDAIAALTNLLSALRSLEAK